MQHRPTLGLTFRALPGIDMASVVPALALPPELLLKAQGVRAAFFPWQGALAEGGCDVSPGSRASARCDRQDLTGLHMLQDMGCLPVVVMEAPYQRLPPVLADAGVRILQAGGSGQDRCRAADALLQTLGLSWQQTAAMGYDWQDLSLMGRAALSTAAADAHLEVRARAQHVSLALAGHGAARSLCDVILVANGRYLDLLEACCA
ncbi:MAG: Phosphatase kdsC [Polaromonas sp.]|nr:Phosphatase kdsC [Polaromonas sp.]